MHITELEKFEDVHTFVVQNLRNWGVKHRMKKVTKKQEERKSVLNGRHAIFKRPLRAIPLHSVRLENSGKLQVPKLVCELCSYISTNLQTEGLFRKAGSSARQKEIKLLLDAGCELSSEHHVIDVANVLKLFFRELPEPLIPYGYHDTFLQCLIVKKGGNAIQALLLACLLLPALHLTTLIYFMEFLQRVISYSSFNKMDMKNIAIVMTPSVMPIEDKVISYGSQRLSHHVQVIQFLLENAEKIGILPLNIVQSLNLSNNLNSRRADGDEELKKKRRRRSGSLTRMFYGLKKIVSTKSSVDEETRNNKEIVTPDLLLTPCLTRSAKKRKAMQMTAGFSNKRRRELLETFQQSSALVSTPFNAHALTSHDDDDGKEVEEEFVRIPKSEYEEIKNRVSAIENRISLELNNVAATSTDVQSVYEKTLEQVEALSSPNTEQLANRLSRELKIRRGPERKVIRSPSARKIGTIRRRSQEGVSRNQSCHIPRVTLKRGRPNTVMTGLPQPSTPLAGGGVGRSSSFTHSSNTPTAAAAANNEVCLEKWASAQLFFNKLCRIETNREEDYYNRDSLAKLRTHNAGMVLAKTKLFNDLSSDNIEKKSTAAAIRQQYSLDKENNMIVFNNNNNNCHTNRSSSSNLRKSPRRNSSSSSSKPVKVLRQ